MPPSKKPPTPPYPLCRPLALLLDVELQTFHVDKEDVPEFDGDLTRNVNAVDGWKNAVGLAGFGATSNEDEAPETKEVDEKTKEELDETTAEKDEPYFMVIPSPAFQNSLDDFLQGHRTGCQTRRQSVSRGRRRKTTYR